MSKFVDAREQDFKEPLQADVCIVGAGAAGITLARYLADSGLDVLMLESGGLKLEGPTQALYQAERRDIKYYDMTACRLRYFGGTSNHWAGYCRPNDPIDFMGRPELGIAPWPIGEAELTPYVKRAAADLGLSMEGFDPAFQARRFNIDPADLPDRHSDIWLTKVFQITTRKLQGQIWMDQLTRQANLRVLLHANVTRIHAAQNGSHIDAVSVRALDKAPFKVKARWFVLAAHAVENARLLLDSDDVIPGGIGNQHDNVGRHFMEHPQLVSGRFVPNEKFLRLYNAGEMLKASLNINFSLNAATMKREGILQYYCRFLPVYDFERTQEAFKQLGDGFWKPGDMKALKALGRVVGDLPGSYKHLMNKWEFQPAAPIAFNLDHRTEQVPNRESRVMLSPERDALGSRKAIIKWSFTDLDYKTFARGNELVSQELKRLDLGTVSAPPLTPDTIRGIVRGHFHHMGTARMSARPEDGVVDTNVKVHGIDNLFVAGSAVYPTAGYSGPTMFLMGFAIRLAEHLKTLKKAAA